MKEFWVSSFRFGVSAFLVPFFLAAFAAADAGTTPGGLVREGNEAFEVGSYDEALKLYRKAAKEKPDSAEITFNQGAASYKKKDFTSATQLFLEAAQRHKTLLSPPKRNTTWEIPNTSRRNRPKKVAT